jgi:hypothetical protein
VQRALDARLGVVGNRLGFFGLLGHQHLAWARLIMARMAAASASAALRRFNSTALACIRGRRIGGLVHGSTEALGASTGLGASSAFGRFGHLGSAG